MPKQQFAVVGRPVAHSLSPRIHRDFAAGCGIDLEYDTLEPEEAEFEQRVAAFFSSGGAGLNLTLPFKERAQAMAEAATERASLAGAANVLWRKEDKLHADNTDGEGLVLDLKRLGVAIAGRNLLIMGAGGAAGGIVPALLQLKPALLVVANRNMPRAMTLTERQASMAPETPDVTVATEDPALVAQHYDLAINATSLGRNAADQSLPEFMRTGLERSDFCYDLNYASPGSKTLFCSHCQAMDRACSDGLGMLVQQAALSFAIWHGISPDDLDTELSLKRLRAGEL